MGLRKSLIISGKGERYFWCRSGNDKIRLVINDVSKRLEPNTIIDATVEELPNRDVLTFVPVEIHSIKERAELYQQSIISKKATYWLNIAQKDAEKGLDHTKAILTALSLTESVPALADQRSQLLNKVNANKEQSTERKLRAQMKRINDRIKRD